jgi:hypothetical protein
MSSVSPADNASTFQWLAQAWQGLCNGSKACLHALGIQALKSGSRFLVLLLCLLLVLVYEQKAFSIQSVEVALQNHLWIVSWCFPLSASVAQLPLTCSATAVRRAAAMAPCQTTQRQVIFPKLLGVLQ